MKWKKVKLLEEVALLQMVLNYQSPWRRGPTKTVKSGWEMRQSTISFVGSVEQKQLWISWDLLDPLDPTVCLIRNSSVETQQLKVTGDSIPLELFCGEQMPAKGEHMGRGTAEIPVVLDSSGLWDNSASAAAEES